MPRTRISCLAPLTALALALPHLSTPQVAFAKAEPILRNPFTLKLDAGDGRIYEERFEKAPYFAESTVFLFAGDHVGINVTVDGDEISAVSYQKDVANADVTFKLTQQKLRGKPAMMLVVQNKLKHPLSLDAFMTVPGRQGIYKTNILPVRAGLSNYESWPHPIVQLALKNFRFAP